MITQKHTQLLIILLLISSLFALILLAEIVHGIPEIGEIAYADEVSYFMEERTPIRANSLTMVHVFWEQGGFDLTTGEEKPLSYRIRAKIYPYECRVISLEDGFFCTIIAFDKTEYIGAWNGNSFVKEKSRLYGTIDISALKNYAYTYWIMGGYENGEKIFPQDGERFSIYNTDINYHQKENIWSYSTTPNIIYQCRNVDDTKYPPESKWCIRAAAENQYDRIRCTVRKTTDGYYFLCHDDTINGIAKNVDGTAISKPVSSNGQTLAELNTYDWGIQYGEQYAGAQVPLLDDFLKDAAIFNLGVTWHAASSEVQTYEAIMEQLAMIDKYGLTDNLIVISSGQNLDVLKTFVEYNPRISCYIGGLPEYFEDEQTLNRIRSLQTPFNKIYVQLFPWGTRPTEEFIKRAKMNNWLLYDSVTMSKEELLDEDMFSNGYSLREINDVYMIKDTVRNWAINLF